MASGSVGEKALALFGRYGSLFGITDPVEELVAGAVEVDAIGHAHQVFQQRYRGVPVFAGVLRAHSDAAGRLVAVNGTFIPDIAPLSVEPRLSPAEAEVMAVAAVSKRLGTDRDTVLQVSSSTLYVFRSNLARGVSGCAHLVWEVEVANDHHAIERL